MQFRHHPDGWIFLDDLQVSLAFFQQQQPEYSLPAEAIGREYVPLRQHILFNGEKQWGDIMPWGDGDYYLSRIDTYRAAWTAFKTSAPIESVPEPEWNDFRSLMMTDLDYQVMLITVMGPAFGGQGNWIATTMQQAIAMASPSIPLVQPLWNQIVSWAPPPLTAVIRWRNYAERCYIPIVFADSGTLSEGTL